MERHRFPTLPNAHRVNRWQSARRCLQRLWRDERGFIVSTEMILWGSIMSLALIAGIAVIRAVLCGVFVDHAVGVAKRETYKFKTAATAVGYCKVTRGSILLDPSIGANSINLSPVPGSTPEVGS